MVMAVAVVLIQMILLMVAVAGPVLQLPLRDRIDSNPEQ